ncbi:MAG: hypothetical protein J6I66_03060 [Lachnospiraceae bacterium]|nr:hypothetical protein [Lachnospiraceae bacterium]
MERGVKEDVKTEDRECFEFFLNVCIIVFAGIGTVLMWKNTDSGAGLMASGFANLKYFTVLSNLFCGIVAIVRVFYFLIGRKFSILIKLMAASATGLTFLIIAAFLQPLYPNLNLYEGGNLYFHLIVPLLAMAEFVCISTKEKIPFKYTWISSLLALAYGIYYLGNILINGIGVWPDSNDWYGFLNWGYPIGMLIFALIVLMDFGIACLLRYMNGLMRRLRFRIRGFMEAKNENNS